MAHHGTGHAAEVLDRLDFNTVLHECLACALVSVNDQGRVTLLNPAAKQYLGLGTDGSADPTVDTLPASLRGVITDTFRTGQAARAREIVLRDSSGVERTLSVTATPNLVEADKPREVLAVLHDLTAARLMESNIRWLGRLASIGTLSASMAHEIKNAMVAVKTFVELVHKESGPVPMTELAGREIRRIDSILTQMLRFASPAKPAFALLHVHEVLDHSLNVIQPQLENRKISLNCALSASPDRVKGDEYQLEQAFLNLLLNALEAMGPDGQLTVSTDVVSPDAAWADSDQRVPAVRVDIRDTGVGVSPENLGRLFDPFFSTKPGGTGLGLAISRRIIEEHHGTLSAQSELNRGTTFSVSLPLVPEDN